MLAVGLTASVAIIGSLVYLYSRSQAQTNKPAQEETKETDNVLKKLASKNTRPVITSEPKSDSSGLDLEGKHSLERLQKLVRLLKPEYCSIYVRVEDMNQAHLKDAESRGQVQRNVFNLIFEKTVDILEKDWDDAELTFQLLQKWMVYFQDDPIVSDFQITSSSMSTDLLEKGKLKRIDVDFSQELPPQITAETTIEIYHLLFKSVRRQIWVQV